MKSKQTESKRNRIILIYLLGVVIPGLVLGYMAFRGIQNEDAFREKQTRQELNLIAQDFSESLNALLNEPEQLADFLEFVVEKTENTTLLNDQLLFIPEQFLTNLEAGHLLPTPDRGWELEFIDQNYQAALQFHQKKGDLQSLVAQARLYRKLYDLQNALIMYDSLNGQYANQFIGNIPVSLSALNEKLEIYQQQHDSIQANQTQSQICQLLLNPSVNYGFQTFDLFSAALPDSLHQAINRSKYLNELLKTIDRYLQAPGDQSYYISQYGYRDLLVVRQMDTNILQASLIDLNRFFKELNPELPAFWRISDEKEEILGEHLNAVEKADFSFSMSYPLSGWKLDLKKSEKASGWQLAGRGMYITIFILISFWLILGLWFTMYLLSQEIRLGKMKTRFISNVTHEFKTPVTSIQHMSELLKLKRVRTEEKKEEFYDSMIEQCQHLNHLIENVLDFSKMDEGVKAYRFEMIEHVELIKGLIKTQQERLAESGIQVEFKAPDAGIDVEADPDALRQVVYNLVDNAQKYGSGRIDVSIQDQRPKTKDPNQIEDVRQKIQEYIFIEIMDDGMGISERDLPLVFDRFYRGDKEKTEGVKGSGIGLTIVKRIVEAHQGTITVESKQGEGTTFRIKLPVNQQNHD